MFDSRLRRPMEYGSASKNPRASDVTLLFCCCNDVSASPMPGDVKTEGLVLGLGGRALANFFEQSLG